MFILLKCSFISLIQTFFDKFFTKFDNLLHNILIRVGTGILAIKKTGSSNRQEMKASVNILLIPSRACCFIFKAQIQLRRENLEPDFRCCFYLRRHLFRISQGCICQIMYFVILHTL